MSWKRGVAVFFGIGLIGNGMEYCYDKLEKYEPRIDYAADSLMGDSVYFTRLHKWRRDSTVLDSVTRTVNTDGLYALYREALVGKRMPAGLMQGIECEELRLSYRYGQVAAGRAVKALQDTVYRDVGVDDPLRYLLSRMPKDDRTDVGTAVCGPMPSPAPNSIGESRLDIELGRPRPQPIFHPRQ